MARSFTIPWAFESPPDLAFDNLCACCGDATTNTFPLKIIHTTQINGKMARRDAEIKLPLCGRCSREDERNAVISFGAFFGVGGVAAIASFVVALIYSMRLTAWLGADARIASEFDWVMAALAALLVGVAIGFTAELLAKILFFPLLGRAFRFAPLLAVEILGTTTCKAGVKFALSKDTSALRLTFMNDDVAAAFARRNVQWLV